MIFYFSATGNTRWAARTLADALGERLLFIPDCLKDPTAYQLADGERLGFCFPVHGWRPPRIVRQFISRLSINAQGHYVYALCTAGDTLGETVDIFEKQLQGKGIRLDAAFSLLMPEAYLGLPFFRLDTPQREKEKKLEARKQIARYIDAIRERRKGVRELTVGRWPRINSRILGAGFERWLLTDKPFRVDAKRCIRCGLCAKVCPVGNVIGGKGQTPQWRHDGRCIACFACYHHCPSQAINYDHVTQGKGQYFYEKNKAE